MVSLKSLACSIDDNLGCHCHYHWSVWEGWTMNHENLMHHFAKCKLWVHHSTKCETILLYFNTFPKRHPLIFWGLYWTMNLHQFCKILVHQHEKHFYWIHTDEKERHTFVASRICKILVHHHQQTNISFELNLFQTQEQMYKDKGIIAEFIPNPAFLLRGRFIITKFSVSW